jgi:hypothetical protein
MGDGARRSLFGLSRIAQLDQRTALADYYLHSAEANVRPQGGGPDFDPKATLNGFKVALLGNPNRCWPRYFGLRLLGALWDARVFAAVGQDAGHWVTQFAGTSLGDALPSSKGS